MIAWLSRRAVLAGLRDRGQWLLVFDNAENAEDLTDWLPGGGGHVLITSRSRGWAEIAVQVEVDVLARAESVTILRDRVRGLPDTDADRIAEALGDLPLAVVQAAGYMAETGIPADEYTILLAARTLEILDQGRPTSYPRSLAAVTQLTLDRLRNDDPAAAELAEVCAFLAPEPIPADWFTHAATELPAPLNEQAADPLAWRHVLARIGRSALARVDGDTLQMHRLTQAILRGHLSPEQAAVTRAQADAVLAANHPGDTDVPGNWPGWARLLPHVLALDPGATSDTELRDVAGGAAWYLVRRGDASTGHDLAAHLYRQWRDQLGPDDRYTLWAVNTLAYALRELGRYEEARQLDEDSLARERRLGGDDHPNTLASANNLALDLRALGDPQAARDLDEDTLTRKRRVLGDDHPNTLNSAGNLALDLYALGDPQAARDLDEDTLTRRRRVLGDNHPNTLTSVSNLAIDLSALGDHQAARKLDEDTLTRRRRVLGDDHPDTLTSAGNLAIDLRALGET
jgi:tetratricopeptide (TPR) repeat protein